MMLATTDGQTDLQQPTDLGDKDAGLLAVIHRHKHIVDGYKLLENGANRGVGWRQLSLRVPRLDLLVNKSYRHKRTKEKMVGKDS